MRVSGKGREFGDEDEHETGGISGIRVSMKMGGIPGIRVSMKMGEFRK